MARETAVTRWPKIVQGMVDDVQQSINESPDEEHSKEGGEILSALQQLKAEMLRNAPLVYVSTSSKTVVDVMRLTGDPVSSPLLTDGPADLPAYNNTLKSFGEISWHNCPWLFAECYIYRYVLDLGPYKPYRPWCCRCCSLTVFASAKPRRDPVQSI